MKEIWFDRKFHFERLSTTFPVILERLEGTPVRLYHKIEVLSLELLTTQPEGSWSIQENIGHLLDLEPLWFGRFEDFIKGVEMLRSADLSNQLSHEAQHNKAEIGQLLSRFSLARSFFVHRMRAHSEQAESLVSVHPRLMQPMRLIDMAYFVAEHDDHHLARITEIQKRSINDCNKLD